jgi:hypothetical protein
VIFLVWILHMRENVVFVFLSLALSVNMIISGSIHFPANHIILFFFMAEELNNTQLCVSTMFSLSIHLLMGT